MTILGQVGVAKRVSFFVATGLGAPRTGLVGGDMVIRITNPTKGTTTTAAPTEVGNGEYYFDIPAAFSTTHGAGSYSYSVEITTAPLSFQGDLVEFFVGGIDSTAVWSEAVPGAFAAGSAGFILGNLSAAAIAAAVWSEAIPGVFGAGTAGFILGDRIDTRVEEYWQRRGLDSANPVTITPTSISFAGITLTIGTAPGTKTITR